MCITHILGLIRDLLPWTMQLCRRRVGLAPHNGAPGTTVSGPGAFVYMYITHTRDVSLGG